MKGFIGFGLKIIEYQKILTVLLNNFQKIYGEFELMSIPENKLNTQQWQSIEQRMQTEEAACVLTGAEAEENG